MGRMELEGKTRLCGEYWVVFTEHYSSFFNFHDKERAARLVCYIDVRRQTKETIRIQKCDVFYLKKTENSKK